MVRYLWNILHEFAFTWRLLSLIRKFASNEKSIEYQITCHFTFTLNLANKMHKNCRNHVIRILQKFVTCVPFCLNSHLLGDCCPWTINMQAAKRIIQYFSIFNLSQIQPIKWCQVPKDVWPTHFYVERRQTT